MINWKIEKRSLDELKGYDKNPRKFTKKGLKDLEKSLKNCGDANIITINKDNTVLGGHARLTVMKQLGYTEVDVKVPEKQLTEKQCEEIVIRLNANNAGEWDLDKLCADFNLEELTEWGLDIELPKLDQGQEVIEDDLPENVETRCKPGDIWKLGEHCLMCGDSTKVDDVEKLMNGEKADVVFTDPPYNVAYKGGSKKREKIKNDEINNFYDFLLDCYSCCSSVMKDGASIYVCHSELERMNFTKAFFDAGFKLSSVIIWAKNNRTFSMNKDYKQKHEPIIYGWKGVGHKWRGGNCEDTLWEIKRPSKSDLHPTMKPIELCARGISNSSEVNDIVYEPFGGSGSTLIACEQLNRKCYTMELDEKYCSVILQRYINFKGNSEDVYLLNNDGTKTKYEDLINEKR